ncbi:TIM44-like domain-containing protein [Nannocystis pusilla]|uniref:TIM44-like domain-containing protein n=1 Tax=Nannocystis pusilla TaxID=889268 RepID=A0ABS7U4H9_9BACT|nr:TIM44-like domain-containing protein [Nannocystis pusilla]MBZ5715314.1 TIM44-like domain-containing protein [Nannocystis pusilla]
MSSRTWPKMLAFGAAALLLALAAEAAARPGGGHGYSGGGGGFSGGGSSGYSGGGSNGGGDAGAVVYLLVRLLIDVPQLGVPLVIVALVILYYHHRNDRRRQEDETWDSAPTFAAHAVRRGDLGAIRRLDPDFSAVLFADFVYALYARANGARGDARAMEALAPYVAPETREVLLKREPAGVPIRGVVIGSMQVERVSLPTAPDGMIEVEVAFEANYSAQMAGGERGFYVHEAWRLQRRADARSRTPETATALGCPNCGAPFERSDAGNCRYCGQDVEGGRFDWSVHHVRVRRLESRPPPLTHHAEEVGTDDRTIFMPGIQQAHAALIAEDPSTAPERIDQRVRTIHAELNAAWTALDLQRVRPYVSDSLFNYLQYWIDAYRSQGLRNVLSGTQVLRMVIVKLERDRWYDALTVRVWASGIDYTARLNGEHVSGSTRHPRTYSEYWTLIRAARVRGAPASAANCPNCGAPLDRVNMAGTCEYCGAHLTRGEFDWVLSKIEQDEAYAG